MHVVVSIVISNMATYGSIIPRRRLVCDNIFLLTSTHQDIKSVVNSTRFRNITNRQFLELIRDGQPFVGRLVAFVPPGRILQEFLYITVNGLKITPIAYNLYRLLIRVL